MFSVSKDKWFCERIVEYCARYVNREVSEAKRSACITVFALFMVFSIQSYIRTIFTTAREIALQSSPAPGKLRFYICLRVFSFGARRQIFYHIQPEHVCPLLSAPFGSSPCLQRKASRLIIYLYIDARVKIASVTQNVW